MAAENENELLAAANDDSEASIAKIRQILFGGQMQSYEQKFEALDKQLSKLFGDHQKAVTKRFDEVASHVDKLAADNAAAINKLANDNEAAIGALESKSDAGSAALGEQLGVFRDAVGKWQADAINEQQSMAEAIRSEITALEGETAERIRAAEDRLAALEASVQASETREQQLRRSMSTLLSQLAGEIEGDAS